MKIKTPTRRLDSSHLTQQERRQALAMTTAAILSIFISLIFVFYEHKTIWSLVAMIGACVLGFAWGRVGTLEDERSGA